MSAAKKYGFVRVPNEIIEALISADLTLREFKIIFLIMRLTFGYNRESYEMSLDFISRKTGYKTQHISVMLRDLEAKKIIFCVRGERHNSPRKIGINPNVSEWSGITTTGITTTGITTTGITTTGNTGITTTGNTGITTTGNPYYIKDNIKDNLKDNISAQKRESDKKTVPKKEVFTPPTVEEVRAYCEERHNGIDPEQFVSFYSAKGWMIGRNKMKNWKMAIVTWERYNQQKEKSSTAVNNADAYEFDWDKLREDFYRGQ